MGGMSLSLGLGLGSYRSGGALEPTTALSSVTYNNTTWQAYDSATYGSGSPTTGPVGYYADGQPFAINTAGVYWQKSNPSQQVAGKFVGGQLLANGSTSTGTYNTSFWKDGIVKDPYFNGDNANGQGFDELLAYYADNMDITVDRTNGSPTLVVTAIPTTGQISIGASVSGTGIPSGTSILSQVSGTTNGVGTYTMSANATATATGATATVPGAPSAAACHPWDATKNVDPAYTGTRISGVGSYVTGKRQTGLVNPQTWNITENGAEDWSVLHIVAAAPLLGAFAPSASDTTKTSIFTKANMNMAALGSGFALPAGMPATATAEAYLPTGFFPFFAQPGEARRRYLAIKQPASPSTYQAAFSSGYSGGLAGWAALLSEFFASALLVPGSASVSATAINRAGALGLQMVGLNNRGWIARGGAGQNNAQKQFVMLAGHLFHAVDATLMEKCLAYEGSATHQKYWGSATYEGVQVTGSTTSIVGNHDVNQDTITPEQFGVPLFFHGGSALPPATNYNNFNGQFNADYELVAGPPSFVEVINLLNLRSGPGGADGGTVLLQDGANSPANPYAAFAAYADRYRKAMDIFPLQLTYPRHTAYYDATRTSSALTKWTGVPDPGTPYWNKTSPFLSSGAGTVSWDLTTLDFATETVTGWDVDKSLDGIQFVDAGATQTGGPIAAPAVKHYMRWRRQSASGWGGFTVNFPNIVGEAERLVVTPTGALGTAVNTVTPATYKRTYPNWPGPRYTEVTVGTGVVPGDVLYAGAGYWSDVASATPLYSWQRDSTTTIGSSQAYTITQADAGHTVRSGVSYDGGANYVYAPALSIPGVSYPTTFNQVTFDGTNDYITRTTPAVFTGAADGKQLTIALPIQMLAGDGVLKCIMRWGDAAGTASSDAMIQIDRTTSNMLQIHTRTSAGAIAFSGLTSTGALTVAAGKKLLMISFDLATSTYLVYQDNTAITLGSITNNNVNIGIGSVQRPNTMASLGATALPNAGLDYLFVHPGFIDLTLQANRDKFAATAGGIGYDGQGPFGTNPMLFMHGTADDWNAGTNWGSGGNVNMVGAVV